MACLPDDQVDPDAHLFLKLLLPATCTSYSPTVSEGTQYRPASSVTVLRVIPVSTFFATTAAVDTIAPVGSVTLPEIEAVTCALVAGAKSKIAASKAPARVNRNLEMARKVD